MNTYFHHNNTHLKHRIKPYYISEYRVTAQGKFLLFHIFKSIRLSFEENSSTEQD